MRILECCIRKEWWKCQNFRGPKNLQYTFQAYMWWFLTCVRRSKCANWEMKTRLLDKLWSSEWLFTLAWLVSPLHPCYGMLLVQPSTNKTSVVYPPQPLHYLRFFLFFTAEFQDLFHIEVETRLMLWFSSHSKFGFRPYFVPPILCLSSFVFQNDTYIRFQLFVYSYKTLMWLHLMAGILIDTP